MSANGDGAAPLLELEHVDAGYGPFRAVFDLTLTLERGRVLTLLGANGAGKTTIARVCSGLVVPTRGAVRFAGEDLAGMPAHQYARRGIVHAPEGRSVFGTLSVEENLHLSLERAFGRDGAVERTRRAYELFPRLGERRRQLAGTLSGGEQRMLSLARALVEEPRLLIADELSLGLAPIVVDEVYDTLGTIRDSGCTLLIIEQHVDHALSIADDAILLEKGRISDRGTAQEMRASVDRLLAQQ
jgi:branched-chain amino acid transport system ATP-binding protein